MFQNATSEREQMPTDKTNIGSASWASPTSSPLEDMKLLRDRLLGKVCQNCNRKFEKELPTHSCPYAEDVDEDYECECNCCSDCMLKCADNV